MNDNAGVLTGDFRDDPLRLHILDLGKVNQQTDTMQFCRDQMHLYKYLHTS